MNIQQLEYLVAVDKFRHFAKAAEMCYVTQPTLSMMIQKLEEELDVKIFDRTKHPVEPTPVGEQVIEQACIVLKYFYQIKERVEEERTLLKGSFKLGIIPTIASYLVPSLLLQKQQPIAQEVELIIKENTTANIVGRIMDGTLDGGLLAGPLNHPGLAEYPIYYEKFYAYVSPLDEAYQEKEIDLDAIDIYDIWLLENEHCLRGQIERLCQLKKKFPDGPSSVKYESGSIDTLIRVVDYNPGITIIPEMYAMGLSEEKQDNLRAFKNTTAVREVSLVVSKDYIRKTLLNVILEMIKGVVPKSMQDSKLKEYVVDL
jgi:LysR family hydrogen peroxide-inducible transcriptional activator